jgi:hypothetical protein
VIGRTLCPDAIINPDNASPTVCNLNPKVVSQDVFADELFFITPAKTL